MPAGVRGREAPRQAVRIHQGVRQISQGRGSALGGGRSRVDVVGSGQTPSLTSGSWAIWPTRTDEMRDIQPPPTFARDSHT